MTMSFFKEGGDGHVSLIALDSHIGPKSTLKALIAQMPVYWIFAMTTDTLPSDASWEDIPDSV